MIRFMVRELLESIGADGMSLPHALLDRTLSGVSTDTRTVKPGDIFFGIRGEHHDGGAFADDALLAGAILAVVNADTPGAADPGLPAVRVADTVRALGNAARAYRGRFYGTVAAVTGTNGKTTVKDMLVGALGTRFPTHGTAGNLNNHIGLPLSVFGLEKTHERAVFELGMNAPGEIAYLAGVARPEVGVILNVGPGHMEFFRDYDEVADSKTELLRALESGGAAVLNADDPLISAREGGARCRIVRFGVNAPCEFRGENITVGPDGCASFRVEGRTIRLRVPGAHNVLNALAAYASARIMGVGGGDAASALEVFAAPRMRMQVIERNGVRIINDSYNANPLSMRAAAETLAFMRLPEGGRLVVALGDMLELGAISADSHREVGRMFGMLRPAILCLVGEHAARYREGALDAGMNKGVIHTFDSVNDALPLLDSVTRAGDTVFVKGSRALGMERLISGSQVFALQKPGCLTARNGES
jgi:UDP-N-acetylmuramoyl-tripeptide--D-alanyl-D-alanine ligase